MEKQMTTKERIVLESLRLFSQKGYDGVSMREIASKVGIKGASIYNHFKGKQDIFNEIFSEMTKRYDKMAQSINIPVTPDANAAKLFKNADEDQLIKMAEGLFAFFAQDAFVAMFRKLLISEQHKNSAAKECLKNYYFDAPVLFQSGIFQGILNQGGFKDGNAAVMALHFYSPIYFTLNEYDLGKNYEACIAQLKQHIHWFVRCYN